MEVLDIVAPVAGMVSLGFVAFCVLLVPVAEGFVEVVAGFVEAVVGFAKVVGLAEVVLVFEVLCVDEEALEVVTTEVDLLVDPAGRAADLVAQVVARGSGSL